MARLVRFTPSYKESIRVRLQRGTSPGDMKAALVALVDSYENPDAEIRRLRRENLSLKALLATSKKE